MPNLIVVEGQSQFWPRQTVCILVWPTVHFEHVRVQIVSGALSTVIPDTGLLKTDGNGLDEATKWTCGAYPGQGTGVFSRSSESQPQIGLEASLPMTPTSVNHGQRNCGNRMRIFQFAGCKLH